MNSKLYRCGWCGNVTDKEGNLLIGDVSMRVQRLIEKYGDKHSVMVNGECCPNGDGSHQRKRMQVTRDMAIDAGDRSLEGQWIDWQY